MPRWRSARLTWARTSGAVVVRIPGRVSPGSATGVSRVMPSPMSVSLGSSPPLTSPRSRAGVTGETGGSTHSTRA